MIHVITPFSRAENVPVLLRHFKEQDVKMTWHPVVSHVPFPVKRKWILPLQVDIPAGADPFCYKLQAFMESGRIKDGERYCVLNDDDLYMDGVLSMVDKMPEKIVFVSMLRGHHIPANPASGFGHPTDTLMADPGNMRPGYVGVEQFFVMGELFRQVRFNLAESAICDGLVAEWLAKTFPNEARYEPELYVLFNRLEPGRWAVDYDLTR